MCKTKPTRPTTAILLVGLMDIKSLGAKGRKNVIVRQKWGKGEIERENQIKLPAPPELPKNIDKNNESTYKLYTTTFQTPTLSVQETNSRGRLFCNRAVAVTAGAGPIT